MNNQMLMARGSTGEMSVAELIADRGATAGHRVAFATGHDGATLSYGELAGHAVAWRRVLAERGIGAGQRVALSIADPLAFATAYLSLLAAHVTVVPLDPGMGRDEAAERLTQL